MKAPWLLPDEFGEQFSTPTFPEEGETSEHISSSDRSICTSYLNHQSRSHREVQRVGLGLPGKQLQRGDSDTTERTRPSGSPFPSTGEALSLQAVQDAVASESLAGIILLATLTPLGSLEIQPPRNLVHWVGTLDLVNLLI
ncbi:hypothetical protein J1605_014620 [Eschrichtius robustus]|uniref:Uncharacterized protein n=1 Tax=Eschrichtius robustus TaxID=9764 RepID=A0AB34GD32_ESCRO|nr:hypothetical protein J1605_014620 [Eschrichtius robustus]